MQSIIRILKVNDLRTGNKDGRPWEMQDAECCLLKDTGEIDQVGVLQIPRELRGTGPLGQPKVAPGDYIGTFALKPDMASRRINAVLTGLQPYSVGKATPASPKASGAQ
jgi:hypothetical protein